MAMMPTNPDSHIGRVMRHRETTVYGDGSGRQEFYVVVGVKGAVVMSFNVSARLGQVRNTTLSWHSPRPSSADIEGEPCGWIEAPGWCTATGNFDQRRALESFHSDDEADIWLLLEQE